MIFKLTTKNCQISSRFKQSINKDLKKITQNLKNLQDDLIVFRLTIRRDMDRYHPSPVRSRLHKSYADTKAALAYFNSSITFRLYKKWLYVHSKGQTIQECVNHSFKLIFKELEKFKDLHFPAESKYPDHSSIRRSLYPKYSD